MMRNTIDRAGAYPVDDSKVVLAEGDPVTDLWLSGYVRGHHDYYFSAKVYDRASELGIGSGRISKLTVWHHGREVMSYDRDWDLRPSQSEHWDVLKKVVAAFPQPTKQQYRDFKRLQRGRLSESVSQLPRRRTRNHDPDRER
jgi:hypothetical protein